MSASDMGPGPKAPSATNRPIGASQAAISSSDTAYGGPAYRDGPSGQPPKRSNRGAWVLLAVVVIALAAIAWIITHAHAPQAAGGPGGGRGGRGGGRGGAGGFGGGVTSVGAAKTTSGDMPIYLNALGTVTPPATVTVRAQVAGQLYSVAFREGQMVKKGQLLAQVDPRPYEAALGQARGNLARDQALLTNAQLDLKRYQTLIAQDSIARQQVDTQAATVRQYEGTLAQDKAAVQAAQVNLGYTRITAPVSGRVGLRQVDPGNYVSTGDTNGLVTIAQIAPIDVVFTLPEDNIGAVMRHLSAGDRLSATAFDRAQTTALEDGYLLTLDNQIDTTTGTVKAKARFTNESGALFPNQFVNLRLLVDTLKGAVVAPSSAVLRGQQGLFVWVVDGQRAVHMRNIKIGPVVGENTAVTEGLQAGETVVTDGSDRLREDGQVSLPGDCPPPLGPPGGGRGGKPGAGAANGGGGQRPTNVGPDGQRCTPTAVSTSAGGGQAGRMQAVLDQLNLDAGQKSKIATITTAMRTQMETIRASGDFAAMRPLRQQMNTQIEAVLRPDQKAKFEELQAQARPAGGYGGAYGGGQGGGGPGAPPAVPAGQAPVPASRGGGAPIGDVPARSAPVPTSRANGTLSGPAPAATAPEGGGRGPGGGQGRGGGMQALLGQLNLDPGQQAKVEAISAAAREKGRAAYESGDMDAARAVRMDAMRQIEAILRPDQKAKFEAAREQMRSQGGGQGSGGGGPGGGL